MAILTLKKKKKNTYWDFDSLDFFLSAIWKLCFKLDFLYFTVVRYRINFSQILNQCSEWYALVRWICQQDSYFAYRSVFEMFPFKKLLVKVSQSYW